MKPDQFHLTSIPENHVRNVWQPATDDLHMNVLVLHAGEKIDEHINHALDVIVTCLRGSGTISIDHDVVEVESGSIVLIPQGSSRIIQAGTDGMVYTTVHRKRGGLMPTIKRQ